MHAQYFRTQDLRKRGQEVGVSKFIRQSHRWISIIFTLSVAANFAAMAFGQPPMWLVYAPLPPLFLLMFSGLYMFALPYLVRARARRA
jgi:hypothetical protein